MARAERQAIRLVAFFEAFKGIVILVAATGLLTLLHKDLHEVAARLIAHAHLNPASKYPSIFLDAAANLQDSRLVLLALGAAAYSAVRLTEAYGLYLERPWAEVLAAGSGAIYLPVEAYEWLHQPSWPRIALLALNALVVALMLHALIRRRKRTRQNRP